MGEGASSRSEAAAPARAGPSHRQPRDAGAGRRHGSGASAVVTPADDLPITEREDKKDMAEEHARMANLGAVGVPDNWSAISAYSAVWSTL